MNASLFSICTRKTRSTCSATIRGVLGTRSGDNSECNRRGKATIDGGDGAGDTARFSGASSDYTISTVGGTTTVTDNNTGDGDDGTIKRQGSFVFMRRSSLCN